MMKTLFSLVSIGLACLGAATNAYAQADFRPGYVVKPAGDTLRGEVDYRGAQRSTRLCRFRLAAAAPVKVYKPADLSGYGFLAGKVFKTRVLLPIDSIQYQTQRPAPIFLEVLVAGPLTLYRMRGDGDVERYFLEPATGSGANLPAELVPSRAPDSRNVTKAYREIDLYRATLINFMPDCDAVRMRIAGLPFTASALTDIVQRYNACLNPTTVAVAAPTSVATLKQRERVRLGLLLGAETSQLVFTGEVFLTGGTFRSSLRPTGGLSVEVPLASLNEKLSLRLEALVEQQRYTDAFTNSPNYPGGAKQQVQLNLMYVRLPLLLRYTLPTKSSLRPFAQAGFSYALRLHDDTSIQTGYFNSRTGNIEYGAAQSLATVAPGVVSYELGLVGSLGLHLPPVAGRALSLEIRAERCTGLLITTGYNSYVNRFFALLGYTLSK